MVLELVSGETLSERLRRGSLTLSESLAIGRQIVDAVQAAHERGIIHRDLKPANVKIAPNGTVKVLDFGLAKAVNPYEECLLDTATLTTDTTHLGTIVGTAGYMSPEQACGKLIDKRTDIWAFGCLLFELISGRRAFSGETVSDTIIAVLEREPPWDRLPKGTPEAVKRLLRRCLQKDPARRLRDIGDAKLELEEAMSSPAPDFNHWQPETMTRRALITGLAGTATGAAIGALIGTKWRSHTMPRSLTRFRILLPEGKTAMASFNKRVAISPDGSRIAFNVIGGGVSSYYR